MANISILNHFVNGISRAIDLSQNTLVVQSLNTGVNTLTDAIVGRLISLQNASEVGATYHTHDTIYSRTTALTSTTAGSAGSTVIGDNASYTNFTPATATVKGALSAIDSALGSVVKTNYSDAVFYIYNSTDSTKHIAFSAAAITTANTRTITMPDANVNLGLVATAVQAGGSVPFTANQSMGGFLLQNLANPSVGTDAVNKNYVDNKVSGQEWRPAVNLLDSVDTTLPTTTATLIDGVTVTSGMRVLFTALTTGNNEVYTASVATTSITWTLATDGQAGTGAPTAGDALLVLQGTNYGESAYNYSGSAAAWVQFNGAGQIQAGFGLAKSGNTLSVQAATGSAITTAAGGVAVAVSATGGIQVASSALSLLLADTSLATSSSGVKVALATSSGLTVSSGLKVSVDGATVGINGTGQVYVPNAGIGATQLATSVADQKTVTGGAGAALQVQNAPAIVRTFTAGQAFSANTTYALRWGIPANTETAGEVYAADITTSSYDLFYVIGVFNSATAVAAGGVITAVSHGPLTLGSADVVFTTAQVGLPVFLGASGTYTATAPTTAGQAVTRLGIVSATNQIDVCPAPIGVN